MKYKIHVDVICLATTSINVGAKGNMLFIIIICVCCAEINVIITHRCDCDNYLRGYKTDRVCGS